MNDDGRPDILTANQGSETSSVPLSGALSGGDAVLDEILDLYAYNRWANGRTLEAAAGLADEDYIRDLGSSFPSVRDTLEHILAAEWIWLSRWRGVSPTRLRPDWNPVMLHALRDRWSAFEVDQTEFLSRLTEELLTETVTYRQLSGEEFSDPLWRLMRHVVNHSTYHRGQVTTMLRQLGAEPASTDLVVFHREVGARVER